MLALTWASVLLSAAGAVISALTLFSVWQLHRVERKTEHIEREVESEDDSG